MDSVPYILAWWLGFLVVGNVAFVLFRPYLTVFADRGYAVGKVIGVFGLTYLAWILGTFWIAPFSAATCTIIVVLAVFLAGWQWYQQKWSLPWNRLILIEEGLFAICLAVWSFVRAFNPRMEGVEKFMDTAVLNSLLRTHYFAPLDPWYAGATINYYYFGHLTVATMAKLTHVPVQYAFNLGLVGTFAMVVLVTMSLVLTLTKSYVSAALSAFLLTLSCNLDPALNSIKQSLYPVFKIPLLKPIDNYIFFGATRLNPYTINEFPLYSFVVADLHAHTLGLPLTVTIAACLYAVFAMPKISWPLVVIIGVLLGATGPTNSFDLVMYAGLTGMVMLARAYFIGGRSAKQLQESILALLAMWVLAIALYLPFYLSFTAPVGGIGVDLFKTGLGFILDNFGILLFFSIPLLYIVVRQLAGHIKNDPEALWSRLTPEQWFGLILLIFALLLIITPEFVYLKDIYSYQNPPYARANTIFKVYFQAWAMLAVVAGCGLAALRKVNWSKIWLTGFVIGGGALIGLSVVGTVSAFDTLKGDTPTTLNGYNYLVTENPDQLALINWMNSHISGQPTIVEASGESYTQRSRISSYTGLPEPIGWASHEWGWRYSPNEWGLISQRMGDVQQIYTTTDPDQFKSLLTKWHIQYIVATPVETDQYHNSFATIEQVEGKPVFQQGWYALYKVR